MAKKDKWKKRYRVSEREYAAKEREIRYVNQRVQQLQLEKNALTSGKDSSEGISDLCIEYTG